MISRLLARLVGAALAFLRATLRVRVLHGEHYEQLREKRVPILFALWHGRMLLPIQRHRHQRIVTMASQSKDGEIIASWLARNGYIVVRGSTTRGGSQALREMVRHVRSGRHAALTVDGPKGPARVVRGSGRSRRETRKFHCLPGTAMPANASMTLRLGW